MGSFRDNDNASSSSNNSNSTKSRRNSGSFNFGKNTSAREELTQHLDMAENILYNFHVPQNSEDNLEAEEQKDSQLLIDLYNHLQSLLDKDDLRKIIDNNVFYSTRFFTISCEAQLGAIENNFRKNLPKRNICNSLEKLILNSNHRKIIISDYIMMMRFYSLYSAARNQLAESRLEFDRNEFAALPAHEIEFLYRQPRDKNLSPDIFRAKLIEKFGSIPAEELRALSLAALTPEEIAKLDNYYTGLQPHPILSRLLINELDKIDEHSSSERSSSNDSIQNNNDESAEDAARTDFLFNLELKDKLISIFETANLNENALTAFTKNQATYYPSFYKQVIAALNFRTEISKDALKFDISSRFVGFDILDSNTPEEVLFKISRYGAILDTQIQGKNFKGSMIIGAALNATVSDDFRGPYPGRPNRNLDEKTRETYERYNQISENNDKLLRASLDQNDDAIPSLTIYLKEAEFLTEFLKRSNDKWQGADVRAKTLKTLNKLHQHAKDNQSLQPNEWDLEIAEPYVLQKMKQTNSEFTGLTRLSQIPNSKLHSSFEDTEYALKASIKSSQLTEENIAEVKLVTSLISLLEKIDGLGNTNFDEKIDFVEKEIIVRKAFIQDLTFGIDRIENELLRTLDKEIAEATKKRDRLTSKTKSNTENQEIRDLNNLLNKKISERNKLHISVNEKELLINNHKIMMDACEILHTVTYNQKVLEEIEKVFEEIDAALPINRIKVCEMLIAKYNENQLSEGQPKPDKKIIKAILEKKNELRHQQKILQRKSSKKTLLNQDQALIRVKSLSFRVPLQKTQVKKYKSAESVATAILSQEETNPDLMTISPPRNEKRRSVLGVFNEVQIVDDQVAHEPSPENNASNINIPKPDEVSAESPAIPRRGLSRQKGTILYNTPVQSPDMSSSEESLKNNPQRKLKRIAGVKEGLHIQVKASVGEDVVEKFKIDYQQKLNINLNLDDKVKGHETTKSMEITQERQQLSRKSSVRSFRSETTQEDVKSFSSSSFSLENLSNSSFNINNNNTKPLPEEIEAPAPTEEEQTPTRPHRSYAVDYSSSFFSTPKFKVEIPKDEEKDFSPGLSNSGGKSS